MSDVKEEPKKEVKKVEEQAPEEKPQVEKLQTLDDGSFHEWSWNEPDIAREPLYQVGASALNIGNLSGDVNTVGEIVRLALNILQSDNHSKLFKFLREELTRTPSCGDPLSSLKKNLFYQYEELREGVKNKK